MSGKDDAISAVVDLHTRRPYIETENAPLDADAADYGGGDGGGGPVEPKVSMKEYVDARDDAVESRLSAKLDSLPTKGTLWGVAASLVGAIFVAVTIILGAMSFGGDRFDGGVSVGPRLEAIKAEQSKTDATQNTQMQLMDDKLDLIIQQTSKK